VRKYVNVNFACYARRREGCARRMPVSGFRILVMSPARGAARYTVPGFRLRRLREAQGMLR
ncbi:hypothetical protein A2U01_0064803, partial [Trifolium medium]|nr:hypothetical protein [Trifolium medium]